MTIQRYEAGPVGTPHDSGYWVTFTDHLADKEAALAAQAERVKETEQHRDSLARIYEVNEKFHWRLVDLFDPEMRGVSPLHYLEQKIIETLAELAALRERVRQLEALKIERGKCRPLSADLSDRVTDSMKPETQKEQ